MLRFGEKEIFLIRGTSSVQYYLVQKTLASSIHSARGRMYRYCKQCAPLATTALDLLTRKAISNENSVTMQKKN